MAKKKTIEKTDLERHEDFVEFLKKKVFSLNYKQNSTEEDYKKTKSKYDKAKLKLKFLKEIK